MTFDKYTLKKNARTEEAHLFFSYIDNNICRVRQGSVCGKVDLEDNDTTIFSCKSIEEMRLLISQMGSEVCGNCAGHLHADNAG